MVTTESTNLYQLVLITKEDKEEILTKIKKIILDLKGKIISQEKWGRKVLAYRVKKLDYACYFLWKISLIKITIQEFKKKLDFNEEIVRYLLLKV
jgi:ribosomal protein S6